MRKYLAVIIFACTVLGMNVNCYAKANLGSLQNGGFNNLSYNDKCDTVNSLVNNISKDLKLNQPVMVSYYDWPEGGSLAYTYYMGSYHRTCINLGKINSEASVKGMTPEYYLVSTVAHELRHSFQDEHQNDDSEYGRAVKANNANYIYYDKDRAGYEKQFVEVDADNYGYNYANRFVKNKVVTVSKQLIANDGKIFDPVFYANKYPDVKNALGTDPQTLLNHYNTYGIKERRLPNGKNE